MEQAWTNDRYDMPHGDMEFWAIRRGLLPAPRAIKPARARPVGKARRWLHRLATLERFVA